MAPNPKTLDEWVPIWIKSSQRRESGCLIWLNATTRSGYPEVRISLKGTTRTWRLGRLILEHKLGRPLKPNHCACHTCDNRACIEAEHLFEATDLENKQDAQRKGRFHWAGNNRKQ